ncbi:hypothetical protein N825_29835 [Skermanella stibiiresistens SB22]|uniref:Uncharacterized protein n=1 Tax=Skermanella stibiiresistens SB22 TaxID=1385369 RepID=W9GXG8_9PROT|nr:hypothetical protein [Skermanella stibiiresistens]EWY36163.1 hypothetical protein N825_29835 [Skermanella stibiiresistens SB22]
MATRSRTGEPVVTGWHDLVLIPSAGSPRQWRTGFKKLYRSAGPAAFEAGMAWGSLLRPLEERLFGFVTDQLAVPARPAAVPLLSAAMAEAMESYAMAAGSDRERYQVLVSRLLSRVADSLGHVQVVGGDGPGIWMATSGIPLAAFLATAGGQARVVRAARQIGDVQAVLQAAVLSQLDAEILMERVA